MTLLFFAASILIYQFFIFKKQSVNYKKITSSITKDINDELHVVESAASQIKGMLLDNPQPSFTRMLLKSKYSYFIFKDKKMIFWSDYKFQPSYENISGGYTNKFLHLKNGKFIIHRLVCVSGQERFEVYFFIPLTFKYAIENNYVNSGINKDIFTFRNIAINDDFASSKIDIYSYRGEFLFSVSIPEPENLRNISAMVCAFVFSLLALVCLAVYAHGLFQFLLASKKPDMALVIVLLFLLLTRSVLLLLNFPFVLIEADIFNSRYFASSVLSPSLGDLFLNMLFFTVFSLFLFFIYYKTSLFKKLVIRNKKVPLVSVVIVGLSFYAYHLVYNVLTTINLHSQSPVDINLSIDFNLFRVTAILVFVLASLNYFIFLHVFCRLFLFLNHHLLNRLFWYLLAGGLLFSLAAWLGDFFYLPIVLIHTAYFFIVVGLRLPKYLMNLRYATYVYFLSAAGVCAAAGALSIYRLQFEKMLIQKNKFASQMLVETDVLAEYLLSEAQHKIEKDDFIKSRFLSFFSSRDLIEQKIKKIFLSNYFEKYDIEVSLYDPQGVAYNSNEEFQEYGQAAKILGNKSYRTEYNNVYFFNEFGKKGLRRYVVFNRIVKNNVTVGFILIQLINKKIIPNSVYPELLVDKKFGQSTQGRNYSFAIYSGNELLSNSGIVNYEKDFKLAWLNQDALYNNGTTYGKYHHMAMKGDGGRTIVVSSEKYTFQDVFSNFSFLFLAFIFFILLFLAVFALYFKLNKINTSYTTKIQIYLNIAFFLPLFVVSLTTLSIISSSYKENLHKAFIKKAESVSNILAGYIEEKRDTKIRMESLQAIIQQMARFTESDINLFGNDGRLIFSSQPLIYENGLLSGLINPEAYVEIREGKSNTIMLSESVGTLNYNSVYVGVKSFDTGKLTGILSIPFFESRQEIERQVIDVLTTIINIFVTIFILFLILSYFASQVLTIPLQIITQRIKRTSLGADNEPIEWIGKDEIGLLVEEYNKMLVKLEQSKEALSKSEKESAWREMAQQIAHEIKNPLTPMKLTIQHLQRGLAEKKSDITDRIEMAMESLLTQVNNLNEIATSFSLFAKMPEPKNEQLNITSLLQSIISLYKNTSDAVVVASMEEQDLFINSDVQSMNGVFSNIIINAIQSVPGDRKAVIQVRSSRSKDFIRIEIKDNGNGIPKAVRDKIFIPNFSTKYAGSGIGLAVAKQSVEHAGGKIWFDTVEGEGTVFFVELPLVNQ